MRVSDFLLTTFKETPADAEVVSHQLMLRAGMIRKLAAGLYTWLPLGLRVLRKVENIIREEMNRAGALETLMPIVQPAELWQESGRWQQYGKELLKINDRHERDFCFGPTHEEVITDIARRELRSYKQLPATFYQIQTKFRDEIRPRFGVMRAREFLMKDAYSFDLNQASLSETYQAMFDAYKNIFDRIGLEYRAVLADTGSIGGELSHEFQVLANSGEDVIVYSDSGDYAANLELASAFVPKANCAAPSAEMTIVDTPQQRSISEVCEFLKVAPTQTVKTLIVKGANEDLVALLLRGDHELNAIKTEKHPLIAAPLEFATEAEILKITGTQPGFVGPVNLTIPIIADHSVMPLSDFICGANENEKHFSNVNWQRDLPLPTEVADLRNVIVGDTSPDGKGKLKLCRGIEVGHIFQLGDKYSTAMQATVLDENGRAVTMSMGCYGIGVSRIVAAAIEQGHDDNGIIWPDSIAPFQIALLPMNAHKSQRVRLACDSIYERLQTAGYEVLLDDRQERPGVLFADADLIGIPHRLVIGERGLDAGTIEYKGRRDSDSQQVAVEELLEFLKDKT